MGGHVYLHDAGPFHDAGTSSPAAKAPRLFATSGSSMAPGSDVPSLFVAGSSTDHQLQPQVCSGNLVVLAVLCPTFLLCVKCPAAVKPAAATKVYQVGALPLSPSCPDPLLLTAGPGTGSEAGALLPHPAMHQPPRQRQQRAGPHTVCSFRLSAPSSG